MFRFPVLPAAITVAVLLSAGFAAQPVRDAASLSDPAESFLERSFGYVALAPLSNVLDMLTLMSVKQHIAFVGALILVVAASRAVRHALRGSTWRAHAMAGAIWVFAILLLYSATALLPRPMATLGVHDVNVVRIDFHSHTSASHDGRAGFSSERNRAWHRAAGFDVAYIADHAAVGGAEEGMARNPNPAVNGTVVLQSMEVTWNGEHVGILGAQRAYRGLTSENLRDIDEQSLALASMLASREPVLVWHHPRRLNRIATASGPGTPGVRAVEVVNGAPDGMDAVRPQRAAILQLAERSNLALVSGTDNHGYGRAAPGWTLMVILNWRAMNAETISREIERGIRDGGQRATRVIERRVADPGTSPLALAATLFAAPARMLTTLSTDERLSWLFWTWALWGGAVLLRRRRAQATR